MIKGADISKFQGNVNFGLLKGQLDFVILKASEGTGYTDPQFLNYQAAARDTGLLIGYYHFARPDLGNTPEAEADWFLKVIGTPRNGEVLALDFEVSFANPVNWCKAFLDHIALKTNVKPVIYLNQNQIKIYDWKTIIDTDFGLWLARYDGDSNNLNTTTPWPTVAMKQWTSSGSLPGIIGNVDLDTFFGEKETFQAYGFHVNAPIPTPAPTPVSPLSDQTKIHIGISPQTQTDFGDMEIQAVRSTIFDQENQLKGSLVQVTELQSGLLKATTALSIVQTQLKTCQENPNLPSNSVPTALVFTKPLAKWLYSLALKIG